MIDYTSQDWANMAENARYMAGRYREMAEEGLPNEERRRHLLNLASQRDTDAEYYEKRSKEGNQ